MTQWVSKPLSYDTARRMGLMKANLGLILHRQQGNNSPWHWFNDPVNQVNSHYWVSKTGIIEQYVTPLRPSWAQASGNATYCSVETEGYTTEELTDAQIQGLAELYAFGAKKYGWAYQIADTVGARGFGWHGMGGVPWGNHPGCPGDLAKAKRGLILDLAKKINTRSEMRYIIASGVDLAGVAGILADLIPENIALIPSLVTAKTLIDAGQQCIVVGGPAAAALHALTSTATVKVCIGRTRDETLSLLLSTLA